MGGSSGIDPALAPARDPLVGSVINGKFHILRAIARGGMGRIYYATQAPLDRPVALKVVRVDGENEEAAQFLKRFLLEASILAKLQHPNVVTLFDYGRIESGANVPGEQYFIAMEYLAGETLAARFKHRQFLSTPEVLFLVRQIGRGLREAHSRGVVHRDLKPSNIILVPEGDGGELVKIVDFGIGKVVSAEDVTRDLTRDGMMVGTPRYMAPEQFEGTAYPASDIYALGTIVYQALAGALPFHGSTLPEFMVAKFAHAIPRIRDVNPQAYLPDSVEQLVFRMLARNPDERPSLDDLFAQLSYCEQEVFGHAQSAPSGPGPGRTGQHFAVTGPHLARSGQHFGRTGSGPVSAPPREPSRVPPTIVAPIPAAITGGNATFNGHVTPRPISTSMRPAASSGGRAVFVALLVIGLLAAGGIGVWAVKRSGTAAASANPPATTTVTTATAPQPTIDTSFALTIDSTPSGASVYDGDKLLGSTPLVIPVERASVADAPRTFTVKKDGFVAATVLQGPTDEKQTKQTVTLAADAPSGKVKPHVGGGTKTPTRPSGGGNDLDIRLNR